LIAICAGALWLIDPRVGGLWWNSVKLAAGVCLIAVPLGTLVAVLIVKTDTFGRRAAALVLVGMLMVPLFLVAGAWDAGFGIQGWHTLATNPHLAHRPLLEGWRAAIWIHGLAAVPWVALIVGAGLCTVETELEEDASLCMSPARVIWHVTLRRAAPAIFMSAIWIAIVASVEISVTDFFQVRTFAEEVYTQAALGSFAFGGDAPVTALGGVGFWSGLVAVVLLATAALMMVRHVLADFAGISWRQTWWWRMERSHWFAVGVLGAVLGIVVGVPLANLIYKAGAHVVQTETGRERDWSAGQVAARLAAAPKEFGDDLWLSAKLAGAAAGAAVLIGLPLAWSLRLARRAPHARLIGLALCLAIPGPLLGIAVIRFLNQPPDSPLSFLAPLYDSYFAPWLVQTIRALPLVTIILWAGLASISQATLDAAVMDGAGWWRRLVLVAMPQRWPAVIVACLSGVVIAFGELAATVLVMPPGRATAISVRVFQLLHYGVDDRVAAISLVMAGGVAAMAVISALVARRQLGVRQ
jgi:iron(III) transport system permease protein